jgi:hypothetical protein
MRKSKHLLLLCVVCCMLFVVCCNLFPEGVVCGMVGMVGMVGMEGMEGVRCGGGEVWRVWCVWWVMGVSGMCGDVGTEWDRVRPMMTSFRYFIIPLMIEFQLILLRPAHCLLLTVDC